MIFYTLLACFFLSTMLDQMWFSGLFAGAVFTHYIYMERIQELSQEEEE
jgi:hypothetical protein